MSYNYDSYDQFYRYFSKPQKLETVLAHLPGEETGVSWVEGVYLNAQLCFLFPPKIERINAKMFDLVGLSTEQPGNQKQPDYRFSLKDNFYHISRQNILLAAIENNSGMTPEDKTKAFLLMADIEKCFTDYLNPRPAKVSLLLQKAHMVPHQSAQGLTNSENKNNGSTQTYPISNISGAIPTPIELVAALRAAYRAQFGEEYRSFNIFTNRYEIDSAQAPAAIFLFQASDQEHTLPLHSTQMLLGYHSPANNSNNYMLRYQEFRMERSERLCGELRQHLDQFFQSTDILFDIKIKTELAEFSHTKEDTTLRSGLRMEDLIMSSPHIRETPLHNTDASLATRYEQKFYEHIISHDIHHLEEDLTGPYVLAYDFGTEHNNGFYAGEALTQDINEATLFMSVGQAKRTVGEQKIKGLMVVKVERTTRLESIAFQAGNNEQLSLRQEIVSGVEKTSLEQQINLTAPSHTAHRIQSLEDKIKHYEQLLQAQGLAEHIAPTVEPLSDKKPTFKL